jgi:integrase
MPKKRQPAPGWRLYVDKWIDTLKAGGLSELSIDTRRRQITKLSHDLGRSPLNVSGEDLVQWAANNSWKPETRKGYRNAASSFFGWLHVSGRADADVSKKLPSMKRPHAHPHPCPDRVILVALGKANATESIMIRLGAECGLRRHEIAQVCSDDVMDDLIGQSLIVHGKGDKQRVVPLPDDLAQEILDKHGWLLPGRWSGHVEASYVGKHIARLLGGEWTAHSLRHRYATKTYEQTHDLYLVSKLLGHESLETTQRYVAMPDSRLRVALEAVAMAS